MKFRVPPEVAERVAAAAARGAAREAAIESAFRLPTGEVVRTGAFHDLTRLPAKWQEEPFLSQVESGFATDRRFWTRKEAERISADTGKEAPYGPYSATVAGSRRAPPPPPPEPPVERAWAWLKRRWEEGADPENPYNERQSRPLAALARRERFLRERPTPEPVEKAPAMPPQSGHSDLWLKARAAAMKRHALNRTEATLERLASQAEREGGFTYSTQSGEQPSRGFAFAASKANEKILDALSPEALSAYIREHAAALNEPGAHLGAWRSPEGKWYLDVSTVEPDRERATTLARKAGQRALYDLRLGEEVPLP